MVLRNVAKTFSLEEQRQEINEIAADLDSLDTTVSNLNISNISNWDAAYSWGDHALAGYWVDNATSRGQWDTAYSWGDHAQAGYLTAYTETDPVFTASAAGSITSTQVSNWDTAYGWGDHAQAGYLTAYTETDPVFTASEAANITSTDTTNWDTAYGWGDHAQAGYLTTVALNDISDVNLSTAPTDGEALIWDSLNSYWKAAPAISPTGSYTVSGLTVNSSISFRSGITSFNYITINTPSSITTGYSLTLPPNDGNNGQVLSTNGSGFLSWIDREDGDVVIDGDFVSEGLMRRDATSGSYSIVTDNSGNWDTAYGWGDHGSAGYLTSIGSISDHTDVTVVSPANGEILTYNGSAWVNSTNLGGSGGSGTLTVATSNASQEYNYTDLPGTRVAYGLNTGANVLPQSTPTYTNTDGFTSPVSNPPNHPDPVSLAFDGRTDTYIVVASSIDGGVVELVFTNPIAVGNLDKLILGFDGNIECGFNGGNYITASGTTGSVTELTVTSTANQTLNKLTFRTPTASTAVGNLYYVIASYGGSNNRLTIKETDISVGSSGTGDNQLIMHDSSVVIHLTPSEVNKVVAVKTNIPRQIILPAGTLMTPGDTVTVIDVGHGPLDRNDTTEYPFAIGAGFPYYTYNSGNSSYCPILIYPDRDDGIQGTNIQPWNQFQPITNYGTGQNGGRYVGEPFHGMPFAINKNGGSIKLMWIGPSYGWRVLP